MKIETENLITVKNFALKTKVSTAYIYKMLKEKTMSAVSIDGVLFIDKTKYPTLPNR